MMLIRGGVKQGWISGAMILVVQQCKNVFLGCYFLCLSLKPIEGGYSVYQILNVSLF